MRRAAITAALAVLAGVVTAIGVAPPATAGVSPGQTLRASVGNDQGQASEPSRDPSVSGDGRYVVFSSREQLDSTALPDSTPNSQIYVRDLVNSTTRLLTFTYSGDPDGAGPVSAAPANGGSGFPAISATGRLVAFQTTASLGGLSANDRMKIVVVDRDPDGDGLLDEPRDDTIDVVYTLVSEDDPEPTPAFRPSIAADGATVVYEQQPDGPSQIVVARLTPSLVPGRYEVARQVVEPTQPGLVFAGATVPAVSGDGKRVVAHARYFSPPPVPGIAMRPLAKSRLTAAALQAAPSERIVGFDLAQVDPSYGLVPAVRLDVFGSTPIGAHLGGDRPLISGDGRAVVFEVSVVPCVSCEFPTEPRAFLADPDPDGDGAIGPTTTTDLLSVDTAGEAIPGIMPAISADRRYAAFVTDAPDAHNGVDQPAGDFSCATPRGDSISFAKIAQIRSSCQVVVRDLVLDKQRVEDDLPRLPGELATPSVLRACSAALPAEDTCASDGAAESPALAGDGSVVAYTSDAEDLVAGDDNGEVDVFARRFTPTVQADPIDFGGLQVGDDLVTRGTVVTPVGFGPLRIQSVAVTGADFTLASNACNVVMYPGDDCAVSVSFQTLTEGPRTGSLDITPNFRDPVKIPISGIGTAFPQPDPAFQVQPSPLAFGERLILSDSATAAVTVTNTGTRRLNIAAVSLPPLLVPAAPDDYRITADTCTGASLVNGATCTVTLVHRPLGPGERPAVLRLDQLEPTGGIQPHLVNLTGAGTTPQLQVNPAVVPVGRITTAIGSGYPPGQVVSIRMPGFPEVVQVTVDAAGTFTKSVLVFPNAVPGSRAVEATVDGLAPAVSDTENLLVVPGTIGPPDFLVRR